MKQNSVVNATVMDIIINIDVNNYVKLKFYNSKYKHLLLCLQCCLQHCLQHCFWAPKHDFIWNQTGQFPLESDVDSDFLWKME